MDKKPSYTEIEKKESHAAKELQEMIGRGEAEIYLITGPRRCGTTATEKFLLNLDVDCQLKPRIHASTIEGGEHLRALINSKSEVVGKIKELHASGIKKPKILIKQTSRVVPLDGEMEYWRDIAKHILIVVRNPALSMESHHILQMHAAAENDIGEQTRLDKLIGDGAASSENNSQRWKAYVEKTKAARDYHDLSETFGFGMAHKTDLWINRSHIERVLALAVEHLKKEQGDAAVEQSFSKSFYGSEKKFWETIHAADPLGIEYVPDFLLDTIINIGAGGWLNMYEHYKCISQNKEKYTIVDFSDMQLDPNETLEQISKRMGIPLRSEDKPKLEFALSKHGHTWKEDFSPFEVAMKTDGIRPPDKTPITLDKYPPHVQHAMQEAFDVYAAILSDKNRIRFKKKRSERFNTSLSSGNSFCKIDPVTAYAHFIGDGNAGNKEVIKLRVEYPQFAEYFEILDRANKFAVARY